MRHKVVLASTTLALLLAACGGDDDDSAVDGGDNPDATSNPDGNVEPADAAPPDAMGDPTLDDLCGVDGGYVDYFNAMISCNPEVEFVLGVLPTDEEISAACHGQFDDYFADGTMSLGDGEAWSLCLDFIGSIDCTTADFDAPNPCSNLIIGSQGEGADCEHDQQCAGDAYCDTSGGGDCGVCAPRLDDDEQCTASEECSSRNCSNLTEPATCLPLGDVGDACEEDGDCLGRLVCNGSSQCAVAPTWSEGDDCTSVADDCGFPFGNLFCDANGPSATDKCVPFLDVGDGCIAFYQCDFKSYEWCDTDGTGECTAATVVGAGDDCGWSTGEKCDDGLYCLNPAEGAACATIPAVGDTCETGDDCWFLQICDSNSECAYGDYSGDCPPTS